MTASGSLGRDEIALLRVAAQLLAGPGAPTATAAVSWMGAVQGQDFAGAQTSVALRTATRGRAEVVASLDSGSLVRSWPMRGTLHLLPAADLTWMLQLCAARPIAASEQRRAGLGLGPHDVSRAGEIAGQALSGGRALTRAELFDVWEQQGLSPGGQRGVHLLRVLAMSGLLVLGPLRGREQLVVLHEEWVPQPRRLERDEALAELALRYFRSHGPATSADFARWTSLPAADVRIGVAGARPQLVGVEVEGTEHLLDPATPDRLEAARAEARALRLLPGFDELLLGYADRSATLDPEHADAIVPGGNGMFRSTVIRHGRVIGTWVRTGNGARQTIAAEPLTIFPAAVRTALPRLFAELP